MLSTMSTTARNATATHHPDAYALATAQMPRTSMSPKMTSLNNQTDSEPEGKARVRRLPLCH